MTIWRSLASILIVVGCLQLCQGSYLGYPRIHFAGHFRADSNTRNNMACNYDPNFSVDDDTNSDWGFNGTNEWQFFDMKATLAVYDDGSSSTEDEIVGSTIVGNLERPFAKLVDLDVDCQHHSTIYGLDFGIRWKSDKKSTSPAGLAFNGKWTRNVVAQTMWPRLKCYSGDHYYPQSGPKELYQDSFPIGAQSTSTITDIDWGSDDKHSRAIQHLKKASGGGSLAVRVSLFYYTRNYPAYIRFNATLGYVLGVIGVPSPDDTLNIPGNRVMTGTLNFPDVTYNDPHDLCYNQNKILTSPAHPYGLWMNNAPFEVDYQRQQVRLDLSNSVPVDLNNTIREFGTLKLGIFVEDSSCVRLLGDIQYKLTKKQLNITSGIYSISLEPEVMDKVASNSFVVVQYLDGDSGKDTKICDEQKPGSHTVRILLQEPTYFVRPKGYYVDRLERTYNPSSAQTLYVTRYGKPAKADVLMSHDSSQSPVPLPSNGVTPKSFTGTSDADGIVEFVFNIDAKIPKDRKYNSAITCFNDKKVTTLPLDGQVYYFTYCVNSAGGKSVECENSKFTIVFLAFSDFQSKPNYNWVDDVGPILTQYARVSQIMSTILDMSSYADVTQPRNIHLIDYALNLDFDDPSYMPTTRDLSTAKRNMIKQWLKKPIYDSKGTKPTPNTPKCIPPDLGKVMPWFNIITPRCGARELAFNEHPEVLDMYYMRITENILYDFNFGFENKVEFDYKLESEYEDFGKNGVKQTAPMHMICSPENALKGLQTAVQLEWATIPTYLTSLYSIVDGCNTEITNIIRSVVMQEMLHFTQSANILIAMGKTPVIDSASITPDYPTHLPGKVLPQLLVTLEKLSLDHIQKVFMGIEVPEKTDVAEHIDTKVTTIGSFYKDISNCIETLGDKYFDPSTVDKQVKWPWNPTEKVGSVVPVTNAATARAGIEMIVSQGEGAGLVNPMDIKGNTLAHFFKFEEIACQHKLEQVSDKTYAYSGDPIPFRADGVWPMRKNPSKEGILPHTNCYTESRAFHHAYRALLRKLQEVFGGSPEKIGEAVAIMESLQVHAKKLMWTKYRPSSENDATTCGPVWDYDWPEEEKN